MSLADVRKQLTAIGKSTNTKHPKVLIAELCGVLRALIDEIDRIDKKPFVVPRKFTPDDPIGTPERIEPTEPWKKTSG
jgi:hypothetical protein